jgi:hypothetical protein
MDYVLHGRLTPVYAETNRERSEAHKMAEGHARNEAEVWLRHDTLVMHFHSGQTGLFLVLHTAAAT